MADVGVEQGCCLCHALSNIYILTSIVLLHVKRKQSYHPLLHVLFFYFCKQGDETVELFLLTCEHFAANRNDFYTDLDAFISLFERVDEND